MGMFNHLTKMGRKFWSSAKKNVANVYHPIKKVVSTIHKGSNFIDSLLDKATQYGVPASLVDLVRDNPVYSTIHGAIETVDDLVSKDIPRLGGAVENFVEHNILQNHAPTNFGRVRGDAQNVIEGVRGVRQRVGNLGGNPTFGFTPNRDPSSRGFIPQGATR